MPSRTLRVALLASVFAVAVALTRVPAGWSSEPGEKPERPRLAVLVVFDQLRGDYLSRWNDLFAEDGFRRLEKEGAWFENCHYPYATTATGPGHASLATGCSPATHGIVDNEWFDRTEDEMVYCATIGRHQRVPPPSTPAKPGTKKTSPESVAPDRLLVPTLGEALKKATGGKARVVSLSFKDRTAALLAGRRPDACYWSDNDEGIFVTSTYYRDRPHPWVAEFNRRRVVDRWFGRDWTRLRPDLDYVRYSGPDDVVGEGRGEAQGRTFPHPTTGGAKQPGKEYYRALYTSPFGNELLLELAKVAVEAEKLGSREGVPDLLCLGFSSNDPVGHAWGPDSQEVLDMTLRSDLIVRDLLRFLDEKVGRGRYVLALSSDHGVCPVPEVARTKGIAAARVPSAVLSSRAEEFLKVKFGKGADDKGRWIEAAADPYIWLNRKLLRERELALINVEASLARWLREQPGIQSVYTRFQLIGRDFNLMPAATVEDRVRNSYYPDRSGDVVVVPKPYHLITSYLTGTSHGTPHAYDTHVPLLVYGPGIRGGTQKDRVTPQAAVPILARALGIEPPAACDAKVPENLFNNQ